MLFELKKQTPVYSNFGAAASTKSKSETMMENMKELNFSNCVAVCMKP